jgi:hypothetical protein
MVVGYISSNTVRGAINELPSVHPDLLIAVGSWERRCCSILDWPSLAFDDAVILKFASVPSDNPDKEKAKAHNIASLKRRLSEYRPASIIELPRSTEMSQIFHLVGAEIAKHAAARSRRLRICMDISSMPRALICYLLLACFKAKLVDEISCFFAISDHSESVELVSTQGLAGLATRAPYVEGNWELMSVPYGEGRITGGRSDNIVVSVGLDTYQILDVIERIEPARALFLMPKRDDGSRIDRVSERQLDIFMERFSSEFKGGRYQSMTVQPYDLGWLTKVASVMRSEMYKDDESSVLLYPFGPKVHSIGLALLALQNEDVAVIGRIPGAYFKRSVEPTGDAELISLTDLSSLTSRTIVTLENRRSRSSNRAVETSSPPTGSN